MSLSTHRASVSRRARPRTTQPERAFLIDGNSFCYRAFYAIRELSTSTGRATNAIYGFIAMLNALVEKEQPAYLGVAFDLPKPTFRHERFKEYKIHRKPMPETLIEQLPTIREVLGVLRVPIFEQAGFEADDVLATIARQLASPTLDVYIVTGDKDALQLVGPHIKVYAPKPQDKVYDEAAVRERFGVAPEQMADLMALMGDPTDNIPAVPGIGPHTAAQLIREFGSVERLMSGLDRLPNLRQRDVLQTHAEQVQLARELTTMDTHVPLTVTPDDLRRREPDVAQLTKLYRALEFKTLLKKLMAKTAETEGTGNGVLIEQATDAHLRAASQAEAVTCIGIPAPSMTQLRAMALVWQGGACVCPLDTDEGWRAVQPLLEDGAVRKIVHDWKWLTRCARQAGIMATGPVFDTMLAAYLLNPAHARPAIEDIAAQYLDQTVRWESLDVGARSVEEAGPLAVAAGETLLAMAPRLEAELEAKALEALYQTVELPLSEVLAGMEVLGIRVDRDVLQGLAAQMEAELAQVMQQITSVVGHEVNLNSPRQLAQVLFEELKLPVVKRTKTGPSTDAETLAKLAEQHPLPAQLLTFRELSKLKSTYVDALPSLMDPATGRIHTTFHQTVTATGRLSSSDPNLQNIPVRTELGRKIRRAFVPEDGWTLLSADYSQIELRILAHLSNDAALRQAFAEGHDIHRYTASLIFSVPESDVTPDMRNAAKTVNFGVIYGMQAHGLSRELRIGIEEAQAFIDAYFLRYPGVRRYAEEQVAKATREGYVATILGRRRYIPELRSLQGSVRQFGERTAINAPIQGSAADLIKKAMIAIHRALAKEGCAARMLLQVHDDLVFELPPSELKPVAALVRRHMAEAMHLDVPIEVTLKTGPNWAELSPLA